MYFRLFPVISDVIINIEAAVILWCGEITEHKGSRKGAMVKGCCFLPQKTQKALENQGLFC